MYNLDTNQIEISLHYNFEKDGIHQINAFTHNFFEFELLMAFSRLTEIIGYFNVDICAPNKGSFIDNIVINGFELGGIDTLITALRSFFKLFFSKESKIDNIQKYYDVTKKMKKDFEEGRISKEEIEIIINHDKKLKKIMGKYFEFVSTEIKSIDVTASSQGKELFSHTIESHNFNTQTCSTEEDFNYDEHVLVKHARITIETPVLSIASKRKWSGFYHGKRISFTISDTAFLNAVHQGKVNFNANTIIDCNLDINYKPVYTHDEKIIKYSKPFYRVTTVY